MHPALFFLFNYSFGPAITNVPPVRFVTVKYSVTKQTARYSAKPAPQVRSRAPKPPPIRWRASPMCVFGVELQLVRGEDTVFTFVPDGGPIAGGIAGWSIRWMLRSVSGGAISVTKDNTITGGITIIDPVQCIWTLAIAKADTASLVIQTTPWYWEARRFDSGASTPLSKGTMTIAQEDATP